MEEDRNRCRTAGTMVVGLIVATLLATCSDPVEPPAFKGPPGILFSPDILELVATDGNSLSYGGTVVLANTGEMAVGPVTLFARTATLDGVSIPGVVPRPTPSEIPTLNVGAEATILVNVTIPVLAQAGPYVAVLQARAGTEAADTLDLRFEVPERAAPVDGTHVTISTGNESIRQGDVVRFSAQVRDSTDAVVVGGRTSWSVEPADGGLVDAEGRFVPYGVGEMTIVAQAPVTTDGTLRVASARMPVTVVERGLFGSLRLAGMGRLDDRYTSDLWVHGDHAYTGTWSQFEGRTAGNRLYAWTLDAHGTPSLSDSIMVDARTVNDVKIRADGRLGVLTHEDGDQTEHGRNGVTFFDLTDPAHPRVVSRFTTGLEPGVHNAWLEGDYAYLVVDGFGNGLRILDVSNPASPQVAASFFGGDSFLHDVYVRDGLAFLSHWDAGLIILDVGNGMAGGSPTRPDFRFR